MPATPGLTDGKAEASNTVTGCLAPLPLPQGLPDTSSPSPAAPSPHILPSLTAIAAAQPGCASTRALANNSASSSGLRIVPAVVGGHQLLCDDSRGSLRPLVPACFRAAVFGAVHGLAHPGIRATRRLISSRWVWRGMASDINAWCRDCQGCQRGKVTRQAEGPVQPIAVPEKHFAHIHVDLVGPLPSSDGHSHLLTVIDRSTR